MKQKVNHKTGHSLKEIFCSSPHFFYFFFNVSQKPIPKELHKNLACLTDTRSATAPSWKERGFWCFKETNKNTKGGGKAGTKKEHGNTTKQRVAHSNVPIPLVLPRAMLLKKKLESKQAART